MKSVVKMAVGYDQMKLEEKTEPKVKGDLLKIRVKYTGICGSDIHAFKGEYGNLTPPVTLGHEFAGEVVDLGPTVKKFQLGDRVTSETTFTTCGTCDYCLSKDYNLCAERKGIGTEIDGSMSEFVLTREESCHLIPENISYQAASLTEPLACCVHAVMERTHIEKDDVVLVVGPGPMGLLTAQVVKSQGGKVILSGISTDQLRLELGKELGIAEIIDTQITDLATFIFAQTDGYGVDKVFDCSGSIQGVNQSLPLIRKQGTYVQVGLFPEKLVSLDVESIIQREIDYLGTRSQKPSSWLKALALMENNQVDLEALISKIYPLAEWREAFAAVMSGEEIKVIVQS